MPGTVEQFIDYSVNTASDTGENNAASINALADGQPLDSAHITSGDQSLRQRTEAVRNVFKDSLYLRDADRGLVIAGPGLITWPGSTTASASGIPVISDNLYVLPMLTPGFAQTPPVPPVASAFGSLVLQKTGPAAGIVVTSLRRSYANGDQISIDVTSGGSFSCTLDVEATYQRTIHIVATGATTLATVITALNALTPSGPVGDTTPIVSAALAVGALGSDLILAPQTKQFVSGNYDGEGHTITPANLAAFFSGSPSSALAEGDTLCIDYAMVSDTASTGGRRQSIPENSNTSVTVGSFFNSRVHPEKLVNAIPICKVVNGTLVFSTGAQIPAGAANLSLANSSTESRIIRNSDFGLGHTGDATRYGVTDWENRADLAVNASWALGVTAPQISAKDLELTTTGTTGIVARIEQQVEVPIDAGTTLSVSISVKQLIAPTSGTYTFNFYWGDANSNPTSSSAVALQVLSSTDASYRTVTQNVTIPGGSAILKRVTIEAASVAMASTGVALLVGSVQVQVPTVGLQTPAEQNARMRTPSMGGQIFEDVTSFTVGQLAALLHFLKASPSGEGTLSLERKDETYGVGSLPPALSVLGRIIALGSQLLATAADAQKARVNAPYSITGSQYTLLWQSGPASGSATPVVRLYANFQGTFALVTNASVNGSTWTKDVVANAAYAVFFNPVGNNIQHAFEAASVASTWTTWTPISQTSGPEVTRLTNPNFAPQLQLFDGSGNARTAFDHLGMAGGRVSTMNESWWEVAASPIANGTNVRQWQFNVSGSGSQGRAQFGSVSAQGFYGIEQVSSGGSGSIQATTPKPVIFGMPPNLVVTLEWEVQLSAALIGASTGIIVQQGFQAIVGTSAAGFSLDGISPNWQFGTENSVGGSTNVVTSVAAASSQRMRIELYGATSGSVERALAYINGVLVAECTTNFPNSSLGLLFWLIPQGGSAACTLDLSPINLRFNRVLSDDAL